MSVKLRLARHGATHRPFYWLVAADSRFARDGRYLEKLGTYNPTLPNENPDRLNLKQERVKHWLFMGAQPSERVIKLLSLLKIEGIDKFTNKKKSTIGKPKTTKNPDKRKSTKNTQEQKESSPQAEQPDQKKNDTTSEQQNENKTAQPQDTNNASDKQKSEDSSQQKKIAESGTKPENKEKENTTQDNISET